MKKLAISCIIFVFFGFVIGSLYFVADASEPLSPKTAVELYKNADYVCRIKVTYEINAGTDINNLMTKDGVFKIEKINQGKVLVTSGGSGFIVENNFVITAAHLFPKNSKENPKVEDTIKISLIFKNSQQCDNLNKNHIYKADHEKDMAAIKLSDEFKFDGRHAYIADLQPDIGSRVFAIGCPRPFWGKKEFSITEGIVANISKIFSDDGDDNTYILHAAQLNSGSSGSALVDDAGYVIGINTGILLFTSGNIINMSVLITSDEVEQFLKN